MVASYNGWTASRDPAAIDIDRGFTAAGRKFPGGVKRGAVSAVLRYVIEEFDRRVEPVDLYDPGDEWGYHYKASANSPSLISNHSSGTAVDINATRHPNGTPAAKTFTPKQIATIKQILAEVDGVVRWLGEAKTPDPMHFEVCGTEAAVARVAARLAATPAVDDPEEDVMPPAPSAPVYDGAGNRWVFVRGTDGQLWGLVNGGQQPFGGVLTSGPNATVHGDSIEVTGRGQDGATWLYVIRNGQLAELTSLGGQS